jgi:hypothetical protein
MVYLGSEIGDESLLSISHHSQVLSSLLLFLRLRCVSGVEGWGGGRVGEEWVDGVGRGRGRVGGKGGWGEG